MPSSAAKSSSSRRGQNAPRRWKHALPRLLFVFSLVYFAFLYGIATAVWYIPPYGFLQTAWEAASDIASNWKNDLNIEPVRHLVPSYPRSERFTIHDGSRMEPGFTIISEVTWKRSAYFGAIMLDEAGRELHYWPVDFHQLQPDGLDPENVYLHGFDVFEDGSILVNADSGITLARIGPCGRVLWRVNEPHHHVATRAYDGTVWTWKGESLDAALVQSDAESGEPLKEIRLVEDIINRHDLHGVFGARVPEGDQDLRYPNDPFHPNDVEILAPHMAEAFPAFAPGDILISLRAVNLVAVLDGQTQALKWHQIGPWHRQHDPDFQPDGSISVYDNGMGLGRSRIIRVVPETGLTEVLFDGEGEPKFYSWRRGRHQILENGNILITETERGRVLEVDRSGNLVWEYNNVFDDTRNGVINEAIHVPPGFFAPGALECVSS